MAKHVDTIISKQDHVVKYVFEKHDVTPFIFEISYINKRDDRNIFCVPTQSMCHMGCKFCHTTDYIGKIPLKPIDIQTLVSSTIFALKDLNLENSDKTFLMSFMGCGEPMENMASVYGTMQQIYGQRIFGKETKFAIATSLPRNNWIPLLEMAQHLANPVTKGYNDQDIVPIDTKSIKLHFSLHYTTDEMRRKYMPKALEIEPALKILDTYQAITGGEVEIHYAMMNGINDTSEDLIRLYHMLKDRNFKVKLLHYNKREALEAEKSERNKISYFKTALESYNIPTTYYIPPGLDIGASCGQFLMDHYIKAKLKEV